MMVVQLRFIGRLAQLVLGDEGFDEDRIDRPLRL